MADLPDSMTITLRKPVVYGGETYAALELREPTIGEVKRADSSSGIGTGINLIAFVTGIPPGAIEAMGIQDTQKAIAYLTSFMPAAPATGL